MLIDVSTGSELTQSGVEWIDTHAHLNLVAFSKDRKEVIKRCLDNNVWVVNVGTNFETSKKAVKIAENSEKGMFASVGLHPINLDTGLVKMKLDKLEGGHYEKEFDYEKYKKLASSEKVVAIGEVGLDYYWKPKTTGKRELFKKIQRELLLQELSLAKELKLPVIFHCRMAHKDLINFLSENQKVRPEKAVAHSFVGGLKELKDFLDLGFYVGFNGMIYKKIEGVDFEEVIENTPLNKLLIETDCPYLSPPLPAEALSEVNEAGVERNEPIFVKYIAKAIAEIKKISQDKLAEITTQNARNLFNI
jgi:TatD DNase family protein